MLLNDRPCKSTKTSGGAEERALASHQRDSALNSWPGVLLGSDTAFLVSSDLQFPQGG